MDKTAAIVTIKSPGTMTKDGRRMISGWLKKTANDLVKHGEDYTDKDFRARYIYEKDTNA